MTLEITALSVTGIIGILYLLRKYCDGGWCYSDVQLDGKTVIVTGCNTGIGKESVRDFVKRGARVIMACRDLEKANKAAKEIENEGYRGEVVVHHLDWASFDSIRAFANKVLAEARKIDILVNNAGLVSMSKKTTKDGFDLTFGTNYVGPFLLTNLLLERIKDSAPSRIVNVSSSSHSIGTLDWDDMNLEKPGSFGVIKAYARSKIGNVLFTKELARRLQGTQVTVYSLHPGGVKTEALREFPFIVRKLTDFVGLLVQKSPVQGAQTTVYCAVSEEVANETGLYYSDCAKKKPCALAMDPDAALKLWDVTNEMISQKSK